MRKIGFIGIGVMGKHMVRNLAKKGYELKIYSRTKEKAKELIEEGITWCDTIADTVNDREAIITMVGYPKDVEEVYFSDTGILNSVREHAYLIDMTTTSPMLSERIYEAALKKNCCSLDAPVSGGDIGAKNATLSIMVGGRKEDYKACLPIFEAIGTTVIFEGSAGKGQHTKMANQIAIAGTVAGTCESIVYGMKTGLDVDTMLDSITKGAAGSWQLSNNGPKAAKGDFAPGFFTKHFIKDMKIAVEEAERRNLSLPVLKKVLELYEILEKNGYGDLGTQALIKYYGDLF